MSPANLRSFPDVAAVLGVLLDNGENAASDNAMGFAEVAIDLLQRDWSIESVLAHMSISRLLTRDGLVQLLEFCGRTLVLNSYPSVSEIYTFGERQVTWC